MIARGASLAPRAYLKMVKYFFNPADLLFPLHG